MFKCNCLCPHILTSWYPQVHLLSLAPCILVPSGSCVLACNLASSHHLILRLMYLVCLLVSSHPHILISLGLCTMSACWYSHVRTSSYPYVHVLQVLVGTLTSSHPHILMFVYSVCLLVSSQPHILIFLGSYTPGACWYPCIFISSYLYVHVLWV